MFQQKRLSKEEGLKKIKSYCSYQERSHREVVEKLYQFGLRKPEVDELVSNLIENNYLNEERFAVQFAGGKFRMKQWGRKKIEYELQQKGVNKVNIKIGLKEINPENYAEVLRKLFRKKWSELKGEQYLVRKSKAMNYLVQKGYEQSLIIEIMKEETPGKE